MSGSSLTRAVFGHPLKLAVVLAGVLLVSVAVLGMATAAGVFGAPDVTLEDSQFVGVNESTTTVQSRVVVSNPNPFPIPLRTADLRYTVYLNGIPVGHGREPDMTLPTGNSTERVQTTLRHDQLVEWWPTHIRRGERSNLTVVATMRTEGVTTTVSRQVTNRTVRTNLLDAVETTEPRPVNGSTGFISNPVLYLNETTAQWGVISENRTPVQIHARVFNPKPYEIPVTGVAYDVGMNDIPVANGSTTNLGSVPARSHENVTTRPVMDTSSFDQWWISHLERNQSTTVRINSTVQLRTAFGNRTVSPEPLTRTVRTDILGDDTSVLLG